MECPVYDICLIHKMSMYEMPFYELTQNLIFPIFNIISFYMYLSVI